MAAPLESRTVPNTEALSNCACTERPLRSARINKASPTKTRRFLVTFIKVLIEAKQLLTVAHPCYAPVARLLQSTKSGSMRVSAPALPLSVHGVEAQVQESAPRNREQHLKPPGTDKGRQHQFQQRADHQGYLYTGCAHDGVSPGPHSGAQKNPESETLGQLMKDDSGRNPLSGRDLRRRKSPAVEKAVDEGSDQQRS